MMCNAYDDMACFRVKTPEVLHPAPQGMLYLENHGEEAEDFGPNGLGRQPTPWQRHDVTPRVFKY